MPDAARDPGTHKNVWEQFVASGGAVPTNGADSSRSVGTQSRLLGEVLVDRGVLDPAELDMALGIQAHSGTRLGRVLTALGLCHRLELADALAEAWGLSRLNVADVEVEPEMLALIDHRQVLAEGWMPVGFEDDALVVAVTEAPDLAVAERARAVVGRPDASVRFAVTTEWDLTAALGRFFPQRVAEDAELGLYLSDPGCSAYAGWRRWQLCSLATIASATGFAVAADGGLVLAGAIFLAQLAFAFTIAFKLAAVIAGRRFASTDTPAAGIDHRQEPLASQDLPSFSVLVPVYDEADMIPGLLQAISALDYPPEKLDVIVLVEDDDEATADAVKAATPPDYVRLVRVPPGQPRTKPRACNVGLLLARGDLLVIYDAEDRPEPAQLRTVAEAFAVADPKVVCIQARLNYYNGSENVLTRLFELEYAFWFNRMLPGLSRMRLPIPLGGTSNHFRTSVLRQLGGWDPHNVTEDADLGVRAALAGYRVELIDSVTWEEACSRVRPWIRQRSRWIKGYLQTVQVHSRSPRRLASGGAWQVFGFLALIAGTPLMFLLAPLLWLCLAASVLADVDLGGAGALGWFTFGAGNVAGMMLHALEPLTRRHWLRAAVAVLAPVYWILHSLAAYKALWQLVFRPYHWEKTPHGLSSVAPPQGLPVSASCSR